MEFWNTGIMGLVGCIVERQLETILSIGCRIYETSDNRYHDRRS